MKVGWIIKLQYTHVMEYKTELKINKLGIYLSLKQWDKNFNWIKIKIKIKLKIKILIELKLKLN